MQTILVAHIKITTTNVITCKPTGKISTNRSPLQRSVILNILLSPKSYTQGSIASSSCTSMGCTLPAATHAAVLQDSWPNRKDQSADVLIATSPLIKPFVMCSPELISLRLLLHRNRISRSTRHACKLPYCHNFALQVMQFYKAGNDLPRSATLP